MNLLALLTITPWLCQSPLELGSGREILSPLTFTMTIAEDGRFQAFGANRASNLSDFEWAGHGIVHEGRFEMIGKQTYVSHLMPEAEIRARSVHLERDVLILDLQSEAPAPIMIRCLPDAAHL